MAVFFQAVSRTSPGKLVWAMVLASLLLLTLEVVFSSGLIWRSKVGWLLSDPYDDWTHALWQVHQFGEGPIANHVFLFGGSSAREAVSSNEEMSAQLSDVIKAPTRFFNFGTRNQSLAESVVLLDTLPAATSGVIVFGLQPTSFKYSLEEIAEVYAGVRFPLDSPALATFLASRMDSLPLRVPLDVVRFRPIVGNYLRLRLQAGTLLEDLEYRNHLYEGFGPMGENQLGQVFRELAERMQSYIQSANLNFELLQSAVRLARSKGYEVVLVELPRNPISDTTVFSPYVAHYRESLQTLADFESVPLLDLSSTLAFERNEFVDHVHLVDSSRAIFQDAFVDSLQSYVSPR